MNIPVEVIVTVAVAFVGQSAAALFWMNRRLSKMERQISQIGMAIQIKWELNLEEFE